jgi:hypothetical protein
VVEEDAELSQGAVEKKAAEASELVAERALGHGTSTDRPWAPAGEQRETTRKGGKKSKCRGGALQKIRQPVICTPSRS